MILFLAPSLAPKWVSVHNLRSNSLKVKWTHLPDEYFRGKPIGYCIKYFPLESKNGIDVVSVNYESNTTTLTNLTSYTMYAITVSAVSSGGIGPANTARARTNAVGTTSFVQFLYLTNFSFFPKKGDRSCPDHAVPKCFSPLSDDINKTAFKIKRGLHPFLPVCSMVVRCNGENYG